MLGNEYNWLITFTRPVNGVPRAVLARGGMLTLAIAVFCFLCVMLRAEPPHRVLLQEAIAADRAGDLALTIQKLEAARALRPDYPRVGFNLARTYAAANRPEASVAVLRALADMGIAAAIAQDPALAGVRGAPGFADLVRDFTANGRPRGAGATGFSLPDMTGIIEGLAFRAATGEWFFGDVRQRAVWRRDARGEVSRYSAGADALLGAFDLKVDEPHRLLWISTSMLPEVGGYTAADQGRAELVAYDLVTGRLARRVALPVSPRGRALGSLAVAADGTVFATDSSSPAVWRLSPGAAMAEEFVTHPDFVSPQGLDFVDGGRALIMADYGNGLWRIDLATRAATLLPPPANATLFGIDGLAAVPGGLIAVQNGIAPQRIVRIVLGPDGRPAAVRILEAAHPGMADPTLGVVVNGEFVFVADAGWSLFAKPGAPPAPRAVPIFHTPAD